MKKSTSITKRITLALSVLIITEIILLIGTFTLGNVNRTIEDNAFLTFRAQTENLGYSVKENLEQRADEVAFSYSEVLSAVYHSFSTPDMLEAAPIEDKSRLLKSLIPTFISIIKNTRISGLFLYLNNTDDSLFKEGIYLKDTDLQYTDNSNHDIKVLVGREEVITEYGLDYTDLHAINFDSSDVLEENQQFYASQLYPENLEEDRNRYWNFYNVINQEPQTLFCSFPLVMNREIIGVYGFDLDVSYFKALFSGLQSDLKNFGFGIGKNENGSIEPLLNMGPVSEETESLSESEFINRTDYTNMYNVKIEDFNDAIVAFVRNIDLPDSDESDFLTLLLINYAKEQILLQPAAYVTTLMAMTVFITFVFGILIILAVIRYVAIPLKQVSSQVKSTGYSTIPKLKTTNITELDDLISSFKGLSQDVYAYSQKLTNAIDIFLLGIFFYQEDSDTVYCTQPFFDICGIDHKEGYCERNEFESWLARITNSDFDFSYSAYHLDNSKWIKVTTKKEGNINIGIVNDVTGQINEFRKVEQERDIDALTKLFNRNAFTKAAVRVFQKSKDKAIAVIMWDIDKLKFINDTYGHEYGDQYIIRFAEVIKTLEEKGGIVARRSGDEFLGLIVGDNQSDVIKIINQLRDDINEAGIHINDKMFERLRISTGIAWYPEDGDNIDTLINYADYALYEVKYNYRGITNYYNKENYLNRSFLVHFNEELEKILGGDFITFAYQPIIDAKTGDVFGYEFLMRIFSETINSPSKLMAIAKLENKESEVETLTFRKGFEAYLANLNQIQDRKIFLNSFAGIIPDAEKFSSFFSTYRDNLDMMVVEFTDYANIGNDVITKKAEIIRGLHAKTALDNCGSEGYTALLLQKVTYDYVKVDLSIVDNIDIDEQHQKVFHDIKKYAQSKNAKIIAVGVKTYEEMKYLIESGVDYLQGYYIGMPSAKPSTIDAYIQEQIQKLNSK